jgi:hypothetical protein
VRIVADERKILGESFHPGGVYTIAPPLMVFRGKLRGEIVPLTANEAHDHFKPLRRPASHTVTIRLQGAAFGWLDRPWRAVVPRFPQRDLGARARAQ